MFVFSAASLSGSRTRPNEDLAAVAGSTVVLLDGLTARTESGCTHGVTWYVRQLARGILVHSDNAPATALAAGIEHVSRLHSSSCDLGHPGTPAAAVVILDIGADEVNYLVLSDVTIVLERSTGVEVVTDQRISATALTERAAADAYPIGSAEKEITLVRMKNAELAQRNVVGGYWVAAGDPDVAEHSTIGSLPTSTLRQAAVLTDGAARIVDTFGILTWPAVLSRLLAEGPVPVLRAVREQEAADPAGRRWPRNKGSDDASIVHVARSPLS